MYKYQHPKPKTKKPKMESDLPQWTKLMTKTQQFDENTNNLTTDQKFDQK